MIGDPAAAIRRSPTPVPLTLLIDAVGLAGNQIEAPGVDGPKLVSYELSFMA